MKGMITVKAYAKLNIALNVLPSREDGFHGIESIFQRISLCDTIDIRFEGNKNSCVIYSPLMALPEENTLTRALKGFRRVSGFAGGLCIRIEKHIPSGAGLGGGSSDAAALLDALNRACDMSLSSEDIFEIACGVGSDVPFFLAQKAEPVCALVTGRGECIEPLESRRDLFFVIICPNVHSSTKEAYFLVDKHMDSSIYWESRQGVVNDLRRMYTMPVGDWSFSNTFTPPMLKMYPVIGEALLDLQRVGALFAAMTGSGSAVFGVFESRNSACLIQKQLCSKWNRCFVSHVS